MNLFFSGITCAICVIVVISTFVEAKIDLEDARCSAKNNNNGNGIQMRETTKNGTSNGDTQITVLSAEYAKGFKDGLEIMKESERAGSGRKCPSEQSELSKCDIKGVNKNN